MSVKHSGGVESSTLIIIVAVLLFGAIVGLLFPVFGFKNPVSNKNILRYVQGEKVSPVAERVTDAYYTKANIDTGVCGIKIFSPLPGQKVSFPLEVSGYVNGCNWIPFEGNAASLEIRDQAGALSDTIIIPIEEDDLTLPAYFKIKVSPNNTPKSNSGVLIFKNNKYKDVNPETFQVPITF